LRWLAQRSRKEVPVAVLAVRQEPPDPADLQGLE
jgi:hypothetical protein